MQGKAAVQRWKKRRIWVVYWMIEQALDCIAWLAVA